MVTANVRSTSSNELNFGGLVIALELTGMSLAITLGGLMKFMPRVGVSLVSEAAMFWWTSSVLISGGPPWTLLCLARVRIRRFFLSLRGGRGLAEMLSEMLSAHFDGKPSRDLCIAIHLPSVSQPHYICLQVTGGEAAPVGSGFLWWPMFPMFPLFLKRTADVLAIRLTVVFRRLLQLGSIPVRWKEVNVTPIPKGPPSSSVANYRNLLNTYTVQGFWASGVGLSWGFCGIQSCASLQPPSSCIWKVLALVMPCCVWHTPYRGLWRYGRRLEWF